MNQEILDYIDKHITTTSCDMLLDDCWNDWGLFLANSKSDVEDYLKHNQCYNIQHRPTEIIWEERDGTTWQWIQLSGALNRRGVRFGRIKVIDDDYDESVIQWLAIYSIPSPYDAEWEIIRR